MASQSSAWVMGFIRWQAMPTSRQRAASPARSVEDSMRIVVPARAGILLYVCGDGKAIHLRHVRIEQHEREGLALRSGLLELGECLPSTRDHSGPHLPATQHLLENAPIRGIIVDHQHRQVTYRDIRHGLTRSFRGVPDRKADGEAECAATSDLAVDPELSIHQLDEAL